MSILHLTLLTSIKIFVIIKTREKQKEKIMYNFSYNEVAGSIFNYIDDYTLVHCIGADFALNYGLGQFFQARYSTRDELRQAFPHYQWQGKGDCLLTNENKVANLVIKRVSAEKASREYIVESLLKLRDLCEKNGIKKIAMTRICTGYDGYEWQEIHDIIIDIFQSAYIEIKVVYLQEYLDLTVLDGDADALEFKNRQSDLSKKYF